MTPLVILVVSLAMKPAAIAARREIITPTMARVMPEAVVSSSSSRTLNNPIEESVTAIKRKAKRAGTRIWK